MAWIILVIAGLLEVIWAIGLKYSHGFSRLTPSIITLVAMAASVFLLAYAMKSLPAGTAYAVWTGIGAVGTAILGIVLLGGIGQSGADTKLGADSGRDYRLEVGVITLEL